MKILHHPSAVAAAVALATVVCLCGGPASASKATDIVTRSIDGFIRPGYRAFHQSTSALYEAGKALCTAPSQAALDADRATFAKTVDAWSRIETIRFGPVAEQSRLERILFWPDRKATGLRQVQAALADKDPTVTDATGLAGKSVAMQGLGALEFVLYGAGSEALATGDEHRCAYGAAISGNLDAIAQELETAWAAPDGFAAIWANPSAQNPQYRDGTEAVTELMGVFVTGTELVRDVRLGGFLGKDAAADKPRQALFWRSNKTVDALAGNLAGMRDLLEASHLADALPAEASYMGKSALFEFANAASAAKGADGPIAAVLADPDRRAKLAYFGLVTSSLSDIFGTQMSGALGLTAGFSSLDGD
ncbi:MAG: peptidase M75, Imelysin [Hyphomicrobiales bacterium]|nr:peptidase M75, Imelysin [Hyphomicrobiales bacterium]